MLLFPKKNVVFFLFLIASIPIASQPSLSQILPPAQTPASSNPTDSLGRTTPSGTVFGFLEAAQRGNNSIAAQYLQMTPARRLSEGEPLVPKLEHVMDRACVCNIRNVSNQPDGVPQEGVPQGRQKIGVLSSGDVEVDLDLVRVTEPGAGKVWLISSDTLAKVPEIYDQVQTRAVESKMPAILVKHELVGLPLWQWLGLLVAIFLAAAVSWIVLALAQYPVRWWAARRGQHDIANWREVPGPLWLLLGTFIHRIMVAYLGLPLLQRHYYIQVASVASIIGANWVLWRIIQWFLRRVRNRAVAYGHGGTGSLMLLGERMLKATVFLMAVFLVFSSLGFNMTTALAGLGIGGLAIGFGAQQTIANLFGGVSVLGDEVIRVGDVCRFGDRTGTVEDIGLRSTRVRTDERTLLAIPNGTVATINVENLSRRDKILFKTNLGMHSETKAAHLRLVLAEIQRLLSEHPKVETASVRVRLTDLGASALNVEVFSYILTRDYNEFAAVREELLLRMMELVDDAGAGLAQSSQTLYLAPDASMQKEKADQAMKKITDLREGKKKLSADSREEDITRSTVNPEANSARSKTQK